MFFQQTRWPAAAVSTAVCGSSSASVLTLGILLASPAWAAAGDPGQGDAPLETLVVSAHRIPASESEVGSSVSILEQSDIEDRQITHAADLLQDVAGVAVSRSGGYAGQAQVRVRGAEANQVLVLIDGVKANDPAGSDEFDFASLTGYDLERVEVIRGPQSALWGSEATAGVINITTRQAQAPVSAGGFIEAGSRDTLYTGASVGGRRERAALQLNATYFETRGDSAALAGTEDDGLKNLTLGVNSNWQPSARTRLSVTGRYNEARVESDGLDFATGLPGDADLVSDNDMLLLKGEGGVSVLDDRWDHNLRLTWLDSDRQQQRDAQWESSTAAEKFGAYYQSTLSVEPASQKIIVAVDYEEERYRQRGLAGFLDSNQDQQKDNLGWVLEYLVAPLGSLNLSASVRHDDNSDFQDVTTYRVTGSYAIAQSGSRFRGSFGTGQKAPTFIELHGFYPDSFVGNPDLEPEQTRGFDLGVVQVLADGRWQASLDYFNERLTDEIVTTFDPASFLASADNLTETSRRQGVELELQGQLIENVQLGLSYTYTDSTQPGGVREVRRPRHMAAANLNYDWSDGRGNINLNLSYTGAQTDQIFPPPAFVPQTVALADYLLVNLAGRYALSPRFSLTLRAENLLAEKYVNVVGYRSPGRSVYFGVRMGLNR